MDPRLALSILSPAAQLFALVRLARHGYHRRFPWFAAYLLIGSAQSLIWFAGPPESRQYLTVYRWIMPGILALQYMVVLELWRRLHSCYRGIHHVSAGLGIVIAAIAMALSFSTGFDGLHMWGQSVGSISFHWLMWGLRYSASMLCIACVFLSIWAGIFDHGVPANTIRHGRLLAGYFGSMALGFLIVNLYEGTAQLVGMAMTAASVAFYIAWGFAFTAKGEEPIERLLAPPRPVTNSLPLAIRRWMPY